MHVGSSVWFNNTIRYDEILQVCDVDKKNVWSIKVGFLRWCSKITSAEEKQRCLPSPSVGSGREWLPDICNGSWSAGPGPSLPELGAETPAPCCAESAKRHTSLHGNDSVSIHASDTDLIMMYGSLTTVLYWLHKIWSFRFENTNMHKRVEKHCGKCK